jgi:hypothetical protein
MVLVVPQLAGNKNLVPGYAEYLDLFLMHWPVAFKRGDDPFPSDKDGNLITDDNFPLGEVGNPDSFSFTGFDKAFHCLVGL